MNRISENKKVCLDFLNFLGSRRFDDALELIHEDVVWWLQGSWSMPNEYHGKNGVKVLLDALDGALAGDLSFEFGALTAEDDRVAVQARSTALLKNGRSYAMTYHYLFHVRDGRIIGSNEYLDTKHLAETVLDGA